MVAGHTDAALSQMLPEGQSVSALQRVPTWQLPEEVQMDPGLQSRSLPHGDAGEQKWSTQTSPLPHSLSDEQSGGWQVPPTQ